MTAINIGDIAKAYSNARLPSCGIIIEATREELQEIAGKILYREVEVIEAQLAKEKIEAIGIVERFKNQIERCGEICDRLKAENDSRKYSRDEVYAIIDELLDGIKPGKKKRRHQMGMLKGDDKILPGKDCAGSLRPTRTDPGDYCKSKVEK